MICRGLRFLPDVRTLSTQLPHTSRTARADTVYPWCARVALLACPDAQGALLNPFLTSPPHHGTGEVRSGTQQRVRSGQQGSGGKPTGEPFPAGPGIPPDGFPPHPSSLSPFLAHPGNPNYRQAPSTRGTNRRQRYTRIVGLRPPSATLRVAHDSTGDDCA
jgi:hypothetical protein